MTPATIFLRYFSLPSRERGEGIVRRRGVRIVRSDTRSAIAYVSGTIDYVVSIEVTGKTGLVSCSCPHALDGDFCKHLWATQQVVEREPAWKALASALACVTSLVLDVDDDVPDEDLDGFEEFSDEYDDEVHDIEAGAAKPDTRTPVQPPVKPPAWQLALERAEWQMRSAHSRGPVGYTGYTRRIEWPNDRRIVYVIDGSVTGEALQLEVMTEKQARNGSWSTPKRFGFSTAVWMQAPDARDREITRLLLGAAPVPDYGNARSLFQIAQHAIPYVLPAVCATGRARLRLPNAPPSLHPLEWPTPDGTDAGTAPRAPWRFSVRLDRAVSQAKNIPWVLAGELTRELQGAVQRVPLASATWVHEAGLCVVEGEVAPLVIDGQWPLIAELRRQPELEAGTDALAVVEKLFALPRAPSLQLPADLTFTTTEVPPQPGVRFVADPLPWRRYGAPVVGVQLTFRYGTLEIPFTDDHARRFDAASRTVFVREREMEQQAFDRLTALGVTVERELVGRGAPLILPRHALRRVAQQLTVDGWWVEADGRAFRAPASVHAHVRSGIDWFDLDGTVSYGDVNVALADVLEAKRRGDELIDLPDGGVGLLPQDWLDRLGPVAAAGQHTAAGMRFKSSQLALLDALLATLPEVDVDARYAEQREALRGFERVAAADPPDSFTGVLRHYQREGLGWMHFLRTFGFGGCLADDMGLGKTIQILALLDTRRRDDHGPSLVVVPRSLLYNWRAEAARFAPALRVADWSSATRHESAFDTAAIDVALVTYGTLRRDAARLSELAFDYVILDEAQAIKNQGTATAKACRVLQARHRLALSGTPVENRLEELWSLLDFLNPGMLGSSSRFATALRGGGNPSVRTAEGGTPPVDDLLARALRPVILRRTKLEVAPELPARIERTLEVELEPKQRSFYEQVRARVRADVMSQVEANGLARSKLHILEGLLRLRQAACHPVLADPRKKALPSAKLDALVPALVDAAAEGNKVLVFSQFTSFLALVRSALDAEGVVYEYLDGRTRDRQTRVERFQHDADCPVFLISLKAGGHGLNLTAADYVYLLDPWWNPAVEAQAIDRAHRIGRARPVIASRLVARHTIEEKILALQAGKRALADAILSADKTGLASIGREELELLLD
ncbi:DEAD/DEAH box helicase [Gemmatimonas sp.]